MSRSTPTGHRHKPEVNRRPTRIALDLLPTMRTRYKIDSYQQTYFVIDSFQQLFSRTAPDFTPLYAQLKTLLELAADTALAADLTTQR